MCWKYCWPDSWLKADGRSAWLLEVPPTAQLTFSAGKKPWKLGLRYSYSYETTGNEALYMGKPRTFPERMNIASWWWVESRAGHIWSQTSSQVDLAGCCWKCLGILACIQQPAATHVVVWKISWHPKCLKQLSPIPSRRPLENSYNNVVQTLQKKCRLMFCLLPNCEQITSQLPLEVFLHVKIFYTAHCHHVWS